MFLVFFPIPVPAMKFSLRLIFAWPVLLGISQLLASGPASIPMNHARSSARSSISLPGPIPIGAETSGLARLPISDLDGESGPDDLSTDAGTGDDFSILVPDPNGDVDWVPADGSEVDAGLTGDPGFTPDGTDGPTPMLVQPLLLPSSLFTGIRHALILVPINGTPQPPPGSITLSISPTNAFVKTGDAFRFTWAITNTFNGDIGTQWSANGVVEGDKTNGLIHFGSYNAPTNIPAGNPIKITVSSTVDPTVTATAWITLTNPILVPPPGSITLSISPTNVSFLTGTAFHFDSVITNSFNGITDVQWSVNGVVDGDATNGLIHFGSYNAPTTIPPVNPIKIVVASTVAPTVTATAWVTLTNLPPPPPISMSLSPTNSTIKLGDKLQYSRVLSNTANWGLTWTVNGIPGGNSSIGTVVSNLYTAPLVMPPSQKVTLVATSQADSKVSATATVNLQFPIPSISSCTPNPITFGHHNVVLTGTGFVPQTTIRDYSGTALSSTCLSPTQMMVTVDLPATMTRFTSFQAANPNPYPTLSTWFNVPTASDGTNMSFFAAGRLLEQATWGPDATNTHNLQKVGFGPWWNQQLAVPPSTYFDDTNFPYDLTALQIQFVNNALTAPDQLRQRVAFALAGFIVVSGVKEGTGDKFAPYLNILSKDALGSYSTLLTDIALCPSMAMYLDMADNDKANPAAGSVPNENFARELMQLFSVGPVVLNPDGTIRKDSNGFQIPLYGPEVIPQTARVFTGWTYPGIPDPVTGHSPKNFRGVMQAVEQNHDTNSKTILGGVVLPAGQTARQDLDATIATLVNHPNCAPYVAFRLIQHLITGNPTPAYVQRVATVFTQTHGDLSSVVRAILTDTEARQGDNPGYAPPANSGHLMEPVLFSLASIRALGAQPPPGWVLARYTANMGQTLFYPPSVFGYYSPYYRTDAGLIAPEFQTLTQPGSLYRLNFINSLVNTSLNGYSLVPLNNYVPLVYDPPSFLQAIANQFYYGQMPPGVSAIIQTTLTGGPSITASIYNGIYLALTSNYYQILY